MVPAYAVYLLQVVWSNDHSNREFATLTVEGREGSRYETEFEVLVDPNVSEADKERVMRELHEVAHALRRQHGGVHISVEPTARLVCLYRVVDQNELPASLGNPSSLLRELNLKLSPICTFDRDCNPVPIPQLTTV